MRAFNTVAYMPLLNTRPAEMRAIEELTTRAKNELLPYIFLGPWTTSHKLDSTLSRIEAAYGDRPVVYDICQPDEHLENPRPVHSKLAELRLPANGYKNWCEFVAKNELVIPSVQIGEFNEIPAQLAFFRDLGREMVVRIPEPAFRNASAVARLFADARVAPEKTCFVLDFESTDRELLAKSAGAIGLMESIAEAFPGSFMSLSSSSFPDAFEGKTRQDIFERLFFDQVEAEADVGPMIYSDRGSARAERRPGGGGQPLPRVDYASSALWSFFREEPEDKEDPSTRPPAYKLAAERAMDSDEWDPDLRIWGSQMIERTANGDQDAIISPMRCTAVRINIHLHRQIFYNNPDEQYDTDEDWTD